MTTRVMYVRDQKQQPVGAIVISVEANKNRAEYQLSVLNPHDFDVKTGRRLKFDRKEAQRIAMLRLLNNPITVRLPPNANQHDITVAVLNDMTDQVALPARATKFAKTWLRNASQWLGESLFTLSA